MTLDLFDALDTDTDTDAAAPRSEAIAEGAWLLHGFARTEAPVLLAELDAVIAAAPLRHLFSRRAA